MNREIKFKIYADNKFYDKCLVGNTNNTDDDKWTCSMIWLEDKKEWVHCDNGIILQYTGLKDKNGVEIYEADIVKINAHSYDFGFSKDRIGEIRFLEGCFGFYQQLSEKRYLFNELAKESGYGELEYYEVIGNIFENSELLEKRCEDE